MPVRKKGTASPIKTGIGGFPSRAAANATLAAFLTHIYLSFRVTCSLVCTSSLFTVC